MQVEASAVNASGAAPRPRLPRTVLAAGLAGVVLTSGTGAALATPAAHQPKAASASLTDLRHQLADATADAQRSGDAVLRAAAESVSLRVGLDDVAAAQAQAQAQLDATAVQVYELAPPQGLPDVESLLVDPGQMQGLMQVGSARAGADRDAMATAAAQSARVTALTRRSDALRAGLVARTAQVYAAQDRARALIASLQRQLLAQARARARAAQVARDKAAQAAAAKAAQAAADAELAKLAAAKAALDAQSSQLALAISPTLSAAGRSALLRQKPLLDILTAAGSGYPAGYHPTGQSLTGVSSWYGPGFVGRSTASGTPYDPELLTCAMKAVPLGTVVRVTNLAGNASVDVMVTDRGPYVGARIIDLSHAAAVAIGNSGLATVRVEILAPGSS